MLDLRRLQQSPSAFRDSILIDCDGSPTRLGDVLDDWQDEDFNALDPGWMAICGQNVTSDQPFFRSYLERPRGHSKTSDLAVMCCWALFASKRKLTGYAAAADRDQAGLLRNAIENLIRLNPWLSQILNVQQWKVINSRTGSILEIISSDVASSWGLTPDFVIVDEISHWNKRDLWDSLISSAAKRKRCMVVCISNAGFSESWIWETRETIRNDPSWYFSRLDGPKASWITEDRLQEQRRLLPSIAFDRLWRNLWSAGCGDALQDDDITRAITLSGPLEHSEDGWRYVCGVDLGLKRDASAIAVIAKHIGQIQSHTKRKKLTPIQEAMIQAGFRDEMDFEDEFIERIEEPTGKIKLASIRIWKPTKGERVSIDGIEKTILRLDEKFRFHSVGFDPWQAALLRERIDKQGIPTEDVAFVSNNLTSMCSAVLETFNEGMISLFDHPQLIHDLRNLRVIEKSYGVRLDSPRGITGHGDSATALAISLHLSKKITIANSQFPSNIIAY